MRSTLRSKLSYANVMATIAVFLALGGAAMAGSALKKNSVGTKQLKGKAVTAKKLANNAVTNPKLAGNAVTGAKIKDGSVGLADTNNSLHQKCQSGTVYVIGSCLDVNGRASTTGVKYVDAEQDCEADGGRMASGPELSSMVHGGLGTIPTPLFSWAFEITTPNPITEAMIISNIGAPGSDAVGNLHEYRCAFTPLA
jgi:hypothetical protein